MRLNTLAMLFSIALVSVHSPYAFNIAKHFISGKKLLEITDTIVFNDLITANIIGAVGYVIHVGKSTTGTIQESLLIMKNNIKNIIEKIISILFVILKSGKVL